MPSLPLGLPPALPPPGGGPRGVVGLKHKLRKEIEKYEQKITAEIKKNKDRTKLYENIRKLKGEEVKKKEVQIYDIQGNKLSELEERTQLRNTWQEIYNADDNCNLADIWNDEKLQEYENIMEQDKQTIQQFKITGTTISEQLHSQKEQMDKQDFLENTIPTIGNTLYILHDWLYT